MGKGVMFLGMGFELVGVCMGGYFFGNYLDAYFGWERSAAYLILLLLIGWFVHLFMLIKKFEDEPDESESSGPQA